MVPLHRVQGGAYLQQVGDHAVLQSVLKAQYLLLLSADCRSVGIFYGQQANQFLLLGADGLLRLPRMRPVAGPTSQELHMAFQTPDRGRRPSMGTADAPRRPR